VRTLTTQTANAFTAAWKGGSDRPMQRATIQRLSVFSTQYDLASTSQLQDIPSDAKGTFTTIPFAQDDQPIELPNIKSIRWSRSVEQEVATMTMVLWNTEVLALGQAPEANANAFEHPGYFTPGRGLGNTVAEYGQSVNAWQGVLVPDRIVRTYEGYGFDGTVAPEADPYMYPSGVWMIDDVDFDAQGLITVSCRDIGRALLDQIAFPPVVPFDQYPAAFSTYKQVANPDIIVPTSTWFRPAYETDSNRAYIGKGLTDHGYQYVDSKGGVRGTHYGKYAFDGTSTSFWISVGCKAPAKAYSFEWIQGKFSSRPVKAVQFKVWGGPYRVYISVYANGKWQGRSNVPYNKTNGPGNIDNGAKVRFVKMVYAKKNATVTVALPATYTGATKIRITFTNLYNSGNSTYKYRAGVYNLVTAQATTKTVDGGTHTEGNYGDYTDVVKWWLAWGGYHWPSAASGKAYVTETDGTKATMNPVSNDAVLPAGLGAVWGDFENTGTAGKVDLTLDIFDKKPLLDCITYVRDIVNFVFFTDETGGAVFRQPNIWSIGNYMSGSNGGPHASRTSSVVDLGDYALLSLTAKLSSKSMRDNVFVANVNGRFGAVAQGYNPYPSGLRRVAGWTDQNFETEDECQVMADLITVRQMFQYRTDQVTIPGNPAIQIDDQVRLHEPMTAETFYHYVKSISSDFDMETGKWVYSLETFWLGEAPFAKWAFDPSTLSAATQAYLHVLGKI